MRATSLTRAAALMLLATLATSFSFGSSKGFDAADTDHNGAVDRGEFDVFVSGVSSAMQDVLGAPPAGSTGGTAAAAAATSRLLPDLESTSFWAAFANSLLMIIVTEIGDKTFFIAAVLAMRQDRWAVYLGAVGALVVMTVLSTAMGFALPNLIPKSYTHLASACLFLYFGLRLLKDASEMQGGGPSEELQEVEEELVGKKSDLGGGGGGGSAHGGNGGSSGDEEQVKDRQNGGKGSGGGKGGGGGASAILSQAFTLTFLAEWGDRSQIATIALASAKDPYGVTLGGCLGHALCTGLAVLGGRMLAARISEKTVATIGGFAFLAFSAHAFLFPEAFD